MEGHEIKKHVKRRYANIAKTGCGCSCSNATAAEISKAIGYSDEDMRDIPDANMGLGCGNPTALGEIREGDTVLDLGSGAGIDCFLAAKKTGAAGKVIGVDMTEEMVKKATDNARKYGFSNIEFRLGEIENLPLEDDSVDVIISNCVINLSPDKDRVFSEAFRVLRKGGRMFVSDIVLLEELPEDQKGDMELLTGCVSGALLRDEYIAKIKAAGLSVRIIKEDKGISKEQYNGIALESIGIEAEKR